MKTMQLSVADLSTLSHLLDEALDLEPAQVEGWLAALPPEHVHLRPRLRDMLAEHMSHGNSDFMGSGPKMKTPLDDSAAHVGDLIGPYRLIRQIGQGGMGAVWLAERADGSYKRQVALKLPRLAWGAGLAERMARERDIGALLEHPHIARLYDAGVDGLGRPYLALEYVDGQQLDAWCEAQGLGIQQRLRLFLQIARAVAYAHSRLVVHRDLKPSNVLVTADGEAHLLDFGIAKLLQEASTEERPLTQDLGRVLTPHYASPEQLRGEVITVASDVYSLGVLLYQLLTGRLPYDPERGSLAALEEAIVRGESSPASSRARDKATAITLRGELDAILAKALRRDLTQRYTTVDALADDIRRHLSGEVVLAQPDSIGYRVAKALRRHRFGFAATAAVLTAVLVGAGISFAQARRANAEAERAHVVNDFVVDIFKVNLRDDPANNELRQLPAEQLLERGGRLIETKFAGKREEQAALYQTISKIFLDMQSLEQAEVYAKKYLAVAGTGIFKTAPGLIHLAQVHFQQDNISEAEINAREGIVISARDGDAVAELEGRLLLSEILLEQAKLAEAEQQLASSEKQAGSSLDSNSLVRAKIERLRARLLVSQNGFDRAKPLFKKAMADAIAAEGPFSPFASEVGTTFIGRLIDHNYFSEAKQQLAATVEAMRAVRGADDLSAALVEAKYTLRLYWSCVDCKSPIFSFEEARAAIDYFASIAADPKARASDYIRATSARLRGIFYYSWGQFDVGYPLLKESYAALHREFRSVGMIMSLDNDMGVAEMQRGNHARAEALLSRALELSRVLYKNGPYISGYAAAVAHNLLMEGDFDGAERIVDSISGLEPSRGDAPSPDTSIHDEDDLALMKIRISLDSNRPLRAQELLKSLRIGDSPESLAVQGEIWCKLDRPAQGLSVLEQYIKDLSTRRYLYCPDIARLRATAGLCALRAGDRNRARQLADLSRQAFVRQPEVSPYYRLPLQQFDKQVSENDPIP